MRPAKPTISSLSGMICLRLWERPLAWMTIEYVMKGYRLSLDNQTKQSAQMFYNTHVAEGVAVAGVMPRSSPRRRDWTCDAAVNYRQSSEAKCSLSCQSALWETGHSVTNTNPESAQPNSRLQTSFCLVTSVDQLYALCCADTYWNAFKDFLYNCTPKVVLQLPVLLLVT